jgi:hypothetical protein
MYDRISELKNKLGVLGFLNGPEEVDVSYMKRGIIRVENLSRPSWECMSVKGILIISGSFDLDDVKVYCTGESVMVVLTRKETDEEFEASKADQRQIGYNSWKKLYHRFNTELAELVANKN